MKYCYDWPITYYQESCASFSDLSTRLLVICHSLIENVARADIDEVAEKYAEGRMRIKLLGAQEALNSGVSRVILGDARGTSPILQALDGKGTVIR